MSDETAMILRLKPDYMLRSYDDCTCVLVRRSTGEGTEIDGALFEVLRRCDGTGDLGNAFLDRCREGIDKGLEAGFLERLPEPAPMASGDRFLSYENRYIEDVLWTMTGRCNMRCRHCYLEAGQKRLGEMPLESALRLVGEMAECGINRISLTGGEALARHGFWRIVDALLAHGIRIERLYSNGALVNERTLDACEERSWKPKLAMSFDGLGHHDWIRGVDVAERLAVDALDLCRKRGFPTEIEYCLHRGNLDTFDRTIDLLESMGVSNIQVNPLEAIGSGKDVADKCLLPEEYFDHALQYVRRYHKDKRRIAIQFRHFVCVSGSRLHVTNAKVGSRGVANSYRLCGHAEHQLYIGMDGVLMPCLALDQESVFRDAFPVWDGTRHLSELIHHPVFHRLFSLNFGKYLEKNPSCRFCEFRELCAGGCRGKSATKENLYVKDAWQCAFFKGGYSHRFQELVSP